MLPLGKIIFTLCFCSFVSSKVITEPDQEMMKSGLRTHSAIYNECGGYIEAKFDQTVILEYKPDEEYENDEFCVWEVRNVDCNAALFTKTKSGFEVGYDYLQISSTNISNGAPNYNSIVGHIPGMEQVSARAYINFVIFTSDNSNTGIGFRLEIVGWYERTVFRVYEDFLTSSPIGSITLRPYLNNMFQIFLIVPKFKTVSSLVLDIEYLTDRYVDYLTVLSMERNGQAIKFKTLARELSGNGTVSYEVEYYANFIVILYTSPAIIPENGGVELSWYAPDHASNKKSVRNSE